MSKKSAERNFQFTGFSPGMLDFLVTLKENNSKTWYVEHKVDYQEQVLYPMQCFVAEVGQFMLEIDPDLEVTPAVNKTISRIYRDTRFSKDKSLYKDRVWVTFKRQMPDWCDTPVYYFEVGPDFYRYGMGYYSAAKGTMDSLREKITAKPEEFLQAIAFFHTPDNQFELEGEMYKRDLVPGQPDEIREWYQRKNFYLACNRPIEDRLFQRELLADVKAGFLMLKPLYQYLWKLQS